MESGPSASVSAAHKEPTEKSESEELLALPAHQLKVTKVIRAIEAKEVSRESAVRLEQRVKPAHKVPPDLQVQQVQRVLQDPLVRKVPQDLQVQKVWQVHLVFKAHKVKKAKRETRAIKVTPEVLAQPVQLEPRA